MKLTPLQLNEHLYKKLFSIYLITGDEPLLIQEAQFAIRETAKKTGFLDRQSINVSNNFNWQEWLVQTQSLSLFSDKRLIELYIAADKIDKKAQEALLDYINKSTPEITLVIITGKLTTAQLNATWAKQTDQHGAIIQIWPIANNQLPQWLSQRAKNMQLQLTSDAVKLLADYTEGNLLAAQQTLEKLKLQYADQVVNINQAADHLANNTRFDIFQLMDNALAGNIKKTLAILYSLKETNEQPVLILWAIVRELRQLQAISYKIQQGVPVEQALTQTGVWEKRKPLFKHALKQFSQTYINQLLIKATNIDHIIKGINPGNIWDELSKLTMLQ